MHFGPKDTFKVFRFQRLLLFPNDNPLKKKKKLQLWFIIIIVFLIGRNLFSERYNYLWEFFLKLKEGYFLLSFPVRHNSIANPMALDPLLEQRWEYTISFNTGLCWFADGNNPEEKLMIPKRGLISSKELDLVMRKVGRSIGWRSVVVL